MESPQTPRKLAVVRFVPPLAVSTTTSGLDSQISHICFLGYSSRLSSSSLLDPRTIDASKLEQLLPRLSIASLLDPRTIDASKLEQLLSRNSSNCCLETRAKPVSYLEQLLVRHILAKKLAYMVIYSTIWLCVRFPPIWAEYSTISLTQLVTAHILHNHFIEIRDSIFRWRM